MIRSIGARCRDQATADFTVWAPLAGQMFLHMVSPREQLIPMVRDDFGYWSVEVVGAPAGARYFYRLSPEIERPDPASHFQPEDIFGASCLVDHGAFQWHDQHWSGIALEDMIIYELHMGTFTPSGTFEAAISKLSYLKELGVTAIEIMPVAQFPGNRNWGYDGAFPFAVQHSYGGPEGFKKFVDACHQNNLAVILDVVYNHVGPEGNVLGDFMPWSTNKYKTPWGKAVNYDDCDSFGVRNFFIVNALHWFEHYHVDGLRLDAVHGIYDFGAKHFLQELSEEVERMSVRKKRKFFLIAESDLNDVRMILPREVNGYNMDAQWCDDFHHSLHALLTGENKGYYEDFGKIRHLEKAFRKGFVYAWDFSRHRRRYHGSQFEEPLPAQQLVVCSQNHDQIGNRMLGERLAALISFEGLKLAAAAVLLSPFVPLLFMGEEYGEDETFLYFMSFFDERLIQAVREGRKREFAAFGWDREPNDPYDAQTFERSKLKWEKLVQARHKTLFDFYRELIRIRKSAAFSDPAGDPRETQTQEDQKILIVRRRGASAAAKIILSFNPEATTLNWEESGAWNLILNSADSRWLGPGSEIASAARDHDKIFLSPWNCLVYEKAV